MAWMLKDVNTGKTLFNDWEGQIEFIIEAVRDEYGKHERDGWFVGYNADYMLYWQNDNMEWEPVCELYGNQEYEHDSDEVFQW